MNKNHIIDSKNKEDNLFKTPTNICLKENLVENSNYNYEFDETDSHITELVKGYCDSDIETSILNSIEILDTKLFSPQKKPKNKDSSNSLSTVESQNGPDNLFKFSSIYKHNLKKRILRFKIELFSKLTQNINIEENFKNKLDFELPPLKEERESSSYKLIDYSRKSNNSCKNFKTNGLILTKSNLIFNL